VFNIAETQPIITIPGAHSDNIKRVHYFRDNFIISGSSDKTLKLWDLRAPKKVVKSLKVPNSVEDFVFYRENRLAVANGSTITLVQIVPRTQEGLEEGEEAELTLRIIGECHVFQKPIMKLRYDKVRDRIVAGGLDNHLKFLSVEDSETTTQLKIVYKIKVPSEIFAVDLSSDGNHFALGLNDGSLIVKSKQIEAEKEQDEE